MGLFPANNAPAGWLAAALLGTCVYHAESWWGGCLTHMIKHSRTQRGFIPAGMSSQGAREPCWCVSLQSEYTAAAALTWERHSYKRKCRMCQSVCIWPVNHYNQTYRGKGLLTPSRIAAMISYSVVLDITDEGKSGSAWRSQIGPWSAACELFKKHGEICGCVGDRSARATHPATAREGGGGVELRKRQKGKQQSLILAQRCQGRGPDTFQNGWFCCHQFQNYIIC